VELAMDEQRTALTALLQVVDVGARDLHRAQRLQTEQRAIAQVLESWPGSGRGDDDHPGMRGSAEAVPHYSESSPKCPLRFVPPSRCSRQVSPSRWKPTSTPSGIPNTAGWPKRRGADLSRWCARPVQRRSSHATGGAASRGTTSGP
jgi:hypothetical protein